jgi:predicted AAA+ superfamily ATPase
MRKYLQVPPNAHSSVLLSWKRSLVVPWTGGTTKMFKHSTNVGAGGKHKIGRVSILDFDRVDRKSIFHTIKEWISILKASFVIFELLPYHANIRKRLVKASKIYFIDLGLAAYLLDLTNAQQIERDPLRGNLFENAVILGIYKEIYNKGESSQFYFYRDSNGNEVDLLIKKGRTISAVEIKSSATFTPNFLKDIDNFISLKLPEIVNSFIVYNGVDQHCFKGTKVIPFSLEGRHEILYL